MDDAVTGHDINACHRCSVYRDGLTNRERQCVAADRFCGHAVGDITRRNGGCDDMG